MARLYEKHMTHNYSTSGKGKSHQNIEEGKHSHDDTVGTIRTGDVAIEHLYPLFGSYCCVMSFFPEWPGIAFYIYYYIIIILGCLGCAGRNTVCCIQLDLILCKKALTEKAYCLCLKIEVIFLYYNTNTNTNTTTLQLKD